MPTRMPLQIVPYRDEHISAVTAFNERARAHQAPFELSKTALAGWLPRMDARRLFREFFLAVEGQEVRGGFTLRRQDFRLAGATQPIANYQGPLSEGIWDRRYMMAGVQMLRAAMKEQPLLYALGMGGMDQPLPKLLASAGWQLTPVPFLFRIFGTDCLSAESSAAAPFASPGAPPRCRGRERPRRARRPWVARPADAIPSARRMLRRDGFRLRSVGEMKSGPSRRNVTWDRRFAIR